MKSILWFRSGATPRGNPSARRGLTRHPVVLAVLALASLVQTGCQTGACGPCSSLRSNFRSFSERAFRPLRNVGGSFRASPSASCCGDAVGPAATAVPFGSSPTIVSPAPAGSPSGSAVMPSAPLDSPPSALEPIPSATPGPPPSSSSGDANPTQGSRSQTGKTNYEALKPRLGEQASNDANARRNTGPEPTTRSAQGSARSKDVFSEPGWSALDNLPPLDIPKDAAQAGNSASRAERSSRPAPAPAPEPEEESFVDNPPAPAAEPAPTPASASVAPGIRRFSGVGPKLAGGSLPTVAGLDWLSETGYRTILDLRENVQADPGFLDEAKRRGLRYVALPVSLTTIDLNLVNRFRSELALSDSRPLYFCDTDGTRAGVMWYIYRLTVDRVDEQVARRDAEELGLTDVRHLAAARTFVESVKAKPAPAAKPAAASPEGNAPPAPSAGPAPGYGAAVPETPLLTEPTA